MKTKNNITAYIIHGIAATALLLSVITAAPAVAVDALWRPDAGINGDWNNNTNWVGGFAPVNAGDTATFNLASVTSLFLSSRVTIDSMTFNPGASRFLIDTSSNSFSFVGAGIVNNSGMTERIVNNAGGSTSFLNSSTAGNTTLTASGGEDYNGTSGGSISFFENASASNSTLTAAGAAGAASSGSISFHGTSTAGIATLNAYGGEVGGEPGGAGGGISFSDTSSAGDSTLIANPGIGGAGSISFSGNSTAGTATLTTESGGGCYLCSDGAVTSFVDNATAGNATITSEGGNYDFLPSGGATYFSDNSTAGNATLIANGGVVDAVGGLIAFRDSSTAANATLIANGSGSGGTLLFGHQSTGGTARVEVFDNGYLDIGDHQSGVTVGSIEGSGNVFLGANNLTVGTNGRNTAFSGVILEGGSLAKIGSGILTLQADDCIADTVGLILVSGSIIKLDFTGPPDIVASLKINGVPQPPGIYGGPMSGAHNILPEFAGSGTVSVGPLSILGNISTRSFVQTGDNVVIGGFIVQGSEPKRVIIRAIGPELTRYGVPNVLVNPTLELHDGTGALIASNDSWLQTIIGGIITNDQVRDIQNSGFPPRDARESAIIADLPAGNYTAIVRGVNDTTGVALVDVYDLNPAANSILGNISTRTFVQTGDNVMIGGFIVQGAQPKSVIVRAIGPELTQYGVPNPLANPTLELHDGTGALIASNNNWATTIIGGIITANQVHDIQTSGYAPGNGFESAIIATLLPGNYTAIVRGVNNTTGVALAEVYDLGE